MQQIPKDILYVIFSYMSIKDLLRFMSTNKANYKNGDHWKHIYEQCSIFSKKLTWKEKFQEEQEKIKEARESMLYGCCYLPWYIMKYIHCTYGPKAFSHPIFLSTLERSLTKYCIFVNGWMFLNSQVPFLDLHLSSRNYWGADSENINSLEKAQLEIYFELMVSLILKDLRRGKEGNSHPARIVLRGDVDSNPPKEFMEQFIDILTKKSPYPIIKISEYPNVMRPDTIYIQDQRMSFIR